MYRCNYNREVVCASGFGLMDRCGPANSRPRTVSTLIGNILGNSGRRALVNIANSNGAFAVTGVVRGVGEPALILTRGGALTTRLYSRFGRFFPRGTIRCFISCCSCCRPRTCIPAASACVRGSDTVGRRVSGLHRDTATTLSRHQSIVVITSISYVCSVNSPVSCHGVIVSLHDKTGLRHSRLLTHLISVRCRQGSVGFIHGGFEIEKSAIRVFPTNSSNGTVEIRFFNSRVSEVTRVGPLANGIRKVLSRTYVCPTSRCIINTRGVGATLSGVCGRVIRHITCFRSGNGLLRTRQVGRHAVGSVRVLRRANFYGKVRGCSTIVDNEGPNRTPFALLSCFPGSFLLFYSRDRIVLPRIEKVCNKSRDHGTDLVRCNFELPSTFSGEPLAFSRFCSGVGRIIFASTAPNRFRGRRSAHVIRRVVEPANLLSPRVAIGPASSRVSSLISRVGVEARHNREILIAALAGTVTRSLAACLRNFKVGIHCVRRSISAVRQVRVVHSLHLNRFSILINVGLLHRNLSVPRISLITVLSTSGRNFLHSRASLIRAVNETTEGTGNRIVVCTSYMAPSVRGTVARALHHHALRRGCGRRRNVAPRAVGGDIHSILRVASGRGIRNEDGGHLSGGRERTLVRGLATRVGRTTGLLRFRRTTCLHSGVGRLGRG